MTQAPGNIGSPAQGDNSAAQRTWNATPVGSQRSIAEPGTLQYFQDLRAYRYGYETPFIPRFFRFGDMAGKSVLEVGVGNGIDAAEIAEAGARYTGIDVTARHLELTRRHFELRELPTPRLVCGDLLETDLGETFDIVYSFGVLHHIPREREYLGHLRGLLRPGGRLLLGLYGKYSLFNAYLCASWALRAPAGVTLDDWRSHVAELSPLGDPVTIRIRSRREVVRMIKAAGLRVERYQKRGFTQGHLPVLGRFAAPDGPILNACGAIAGWYHLLDCRPDGGR